MLSSAHEQEYIMVIRSIKNFIQNVPSAKEEKINGIPLIFSSSCL